MKVVHVCRIGWPHTGGMEAAVDGLARALAGRGHDVRVVTLDHAITDGTPLPEARHDGVPYLRVPRVGPRMYPFARGLGRHLRGADVVHVHGLDGLADLVVRGRHGARVGISTHGGYFHTPRLGPVKEAWLRTVTRRTLRRADAVWYTSEADRDRLAAAGVPGPVMVNGVDTSRFADLRRAPEAGRFVVFGRLDVHKGLSDLLDALGALAARDPRPFFLDVVGPEAAPGLVDGLRRRAGGLPVRFHGALPEARLREVLSTAELALFPSRYEGFGIAVVELMAAGIPVVVSAIPAFDRLVQPGVSGHRVDFTRAEQAARALASIREAEHDPLVREARRAAARYSWDRRVEEWVLAYRALAGSAGT